MKCYTLQNHRISPPQFPNRNRGVNHLEKLKVFASDHQSDLTLEFLMSRSNRGNRRSPGYRRIPNPGEKRESEWVRGREVPCIYSEKMNE
ncbi:hypothetical protein CEXT_541321 [Caerostris extrusa]|uniref:Uncharacterized protein n=1 Tax=Caerostris extrusa TaxID=172846 RepID=A0AAV4XG37_CAEEX|nr:hypothetical protein CEXT_541321 [Caerostris extrusa]